jgi:hypothetical protein
MFGPLFDGMLPEKRVRHVRCTEPKAVGIPVDEEIEKKIYDFLAPPESSELSSDRKP